MSSFRDELELIKEAEAKDDKLFTKDVWKQFAKNVAVGGVGYGTGHTLGRLMGAYGLPVLRASKSPQRVEMLARLGSVLGTVGSIAMANALGEGQKKVEKARRNNGKS